MELQCVITKSFPVVTGVSQTTGKNWSKLDFVVETYDRFPKKIFMTLFGEQAIANNPIVLNAPVKVSFDVESRSYMCHDGTERYSTEVKAWKIESMQQAQQVPTQPQTQYQPQQQYDAPPF